MFSTFKRIALFLLANIAVVLTITAVSFVLERFLGIDITKDLGGYAGLAVMAIVYGFTGSFVSLFLSKWMAKNAYDITLLSEERLMDYSQKEQLVYATIARIAGQNGIKMPEV